ncbi:MAG: hypothetical protein DIU56_010135 [Pseudomonadota bacterium]|jgi:hypothetical protein|nr:MAG: hypothetical protein DIU56_03550 [Pseudomonadota bacterium]
MKLSALIYSLVNDLGTVRPDDGDLALASMLFGMALAWAVIHLVQQRRARRASSASSPATRTDRSRRLDAHQAPG